MGSCVMHCYWDLETLAASFWISPATLARYAWMRGATTSKASAPTGMRKNKTGATDAGRMP